MEDIYSVKSFHASQVEPSLSVGKITEKEKFQAAKQILLGIAILYILTIIVYLIRPLEGDKLIDICTTIFPPLATLILVSYFRERGQ